MFLMLTSTARTFEAAKTDSMPCGRGYSSGVATWIDPTRYTVAVGEVTFHIRKRRGLAGSTMDGCGFADCRAALWACAWHAARAMNKVTKACFKNRFVSGHGFMSLP